LKRASAQQAALEAQQAAEEAAEEAAERAAKRSAWPEFEKKYAYLFEDDIPDWFVDFFYIDKERGRFVVYKKDKLKGLIAICEAEKRKADDFMEDFKWFKEHWLNKTELDSVVNEARIQFEKAAGIKLDEPLEYRISLS
jgi:hypothetical protein